MALTDELENILRGETEIRTREFKKSMSWEDPTTQLKVVKFALGAAYLSDGGSISFGLEPSGPIHKPVGMSQDHHDSFDHDSVSEKVNTHATPHIDLTVKHVTMDGHLFVVIIVRPMSDYPIICSKDFVIGKERPEIIKGRMYCRSRRTPETTEVQSPEDLRDIIDVGFGKHLQRYFRLRAIEEGQVDGRQLAAAPSSAEAFNKQAEDLLK